MRIVVFGVTGQIGQRLAREALSRGHEVTGVVRDPSRATSPDARIRLVQGDVTDASSVAAVAQGADAVVSAISPRPGTTGKAPTLVAAARGLIAGLPKAGVSRVLAVGGAGSLEVTPGVALVDTPQFPEIYKPEALDGRAALGVFRAEAGALAWTFFSPAGVILPGERTGKFRVGGDQLLVDAKGESRISMEDFAVAAIDELEKPAHVRARFTVGY